MNTNVFAAANSIGELLGPDLAIIAKLAVITIVIALPILFLAYRRAKRTGRR